MKYKIVKEEAARCLECGNVITYGRTDKKFCDDTCRNRWHNRNAHDVRAVHARINGHLARNYKLLTGLLKVGITTIPLTELAIGGFQSEYYTGSARRRGYMEYMCYELCYEIADGTVKNLRRLSRPGQ